MESNSVLMDTAMVVRYKVGVDSKGNDIFKNQRANELNLTATDEVLLDIADVIGSFIDYEVSQVTKESVHLLSR